MHVRRRWGMQGQNLVLAAGVVVLGVVVIMTLQRFLTSDENTKPPAESRYLTDERTVVRVPTSDQSFDTGAHRRNGPSTTGRTGGAVAGTGRSSVSYAGVSRALAGSTSDAVGEALHAGLRDVAASTAIVVRLFGTAFGDFVYHRDSGWLQFVDGEWRRLDPFDLPRLLHELYPDLCLPEAAAGGGGGDGSFDRARWVAQPQGAFEEEP